MPGPPRGHKPRDEPYAKAVRYVMARAVDGVKISELPTTLHRRVAERLVDRGELDYIRLPSGDGIVSRKQAG
jgi:hypothetical protein